MKSCSSEIQAESSPGRMDELKFFIVVAYFSPIIVDLRGKNSGNSNPSECKKTEAIILLAAVA
jgi:hypothetical protein